MTNAKQDFYVFLSCLFSKLIKNESNMGWNFGKPKTMNKYLKTKK